jgi:hypothetical protein
MFVAETFSGTKEEMYEELLRQAQGCSKASVTLLQMRRTCRH